MEITGRQSRLSGQVKFFVDAVPFMRLVFSRFKGQLATHGNFCSRDQASTASEKPDRSQSGNAKTYIVPAPLPTMYCFPFTA